MPRNGLGIYSLPPGINPVQPQTSITTNWANTTLQDIATTLTTSLSSDGQTTPTGNINLGSFKIINLAAPTLPTDAVNYGTFTAGTGATGNWAISAQTVTGLTAVGQIPFAVTTTAGSTVGTVAGDNNLTWNNTKKQLTITGITSIEEGLEKVVVSPTVVVGTQTVNVYNGAFYLFNVAANGNFNFNFTGTAAGTTVNTLNNIMTIGTSMSLTIAILMGATPFYNSTANMIDGNVVTTRWQGPVSPSFGNANGYDIYSFTIIKTADATFTVFASRAQFAGLTSFAV